MEFNEVKEEYDKILKLLAEINGKTITELDTEISEAVAKSKNIEDILIKSAEIMSTTQA